MDVRDRAGEPVLLRFADGSEARADAVVACDGIKSAARARLFPGAQPAYSGVFAYRGLVPMATAVLWTGDGRPGGR